MQMLTRKSEPHLVPLGSLLPEVDVAPLYLDPCSLPAVHIREETDVILPADVSYMASAEACLAQPDALLARQLNLSEVEELLAAQFHLAAWSEQHVDLQESA